MKKRVVIDGRMMGWTGIGRITKRLIEHAQQIDSDNEYIVLLLKRDWEKWEPTAANFRKELADYYPYGWQEQLLLPLKLYKLKPDLVHFLHFNLPLAYFGHYVVTINDLTLIESKNIQGTGLKRVIYEFKYWIMRLMLRHDVHVASHILTISKYVKDQLSKRFRISPDKITVTYPAPEIATAKPSELDSLKIGGPFLLYVGNPYPHKNLPRLIEAFELVAKANKALCLVIVSNTTVGNTAGFYEALKLQAAGGAAGDRVIFPGYVTDSQLVALYKQSELLVFPSLSEGFGLPPLEAMAYGTPVISSNLSCMPEVCGDAAAYFNPLDSNNMASKIQALLADKKELARLRQAGPEHIKRFSWEQMTSRVLEVYRLANK